MSESKIENIIELGFGPSIELLAETPSTQDAARLLIEALPVLEATKKYDNFLKNFILAKLCKGMHVSIYRDAILQIDEKRNFKVSASTSPMWRFTWAQGEAVKMSDMVQFMLKTVKRSGTPRHPWLETMQALYVSLHGSVLSDLSGDERLSMPFPSWPLEEGALDNIKGSDEPSEMSRDDSTMLFQDEDEGKGENVETIWVESSSDGEEGKSLATKPVNRRIRGKGGASLGAPSCLPAELIPDFQIVTGCLKNTSASMSEGLFDQGEHKQATRAEKRKKKAEIMVKSAKATLRRLGHLVEEVKDPIKGKKGKVVKKKKKIKITKKTKRKNKQKQVAKQNNAPAQKGPAQNEVPKQEGMTKQKEVRKLAAVSKMAKPNSKDTKANGDKSRNPVMMPDGEVIYDESEVEKVVVKSWKERTRMLVALTHRNKKVVVFSANAYGGVRQARKLATTLREYYLKGWTKEQLVAIKHDIV